VAQSSGVVALASSGALVVVVVGVLDLSNIGHHRVNVVGERKTSDSGCASNGALVSVDSDQSLGSLHIASLEGYVYLNPVKAIVDGNTHTIDNCLGKAKKSGLDVVSEVGKITVSGLHDNRLGGESLIRSGLESKSECLVRRGKSAEMFGELEFNHLGLVLASGGEVVSDIKRIGTPLAKSL